MKLLYICGFPRSGTTYLQRYLLSSLHCTGLDDEQGLDVVWRAMGIVKDRHIDEITADLWSRFPSQTPIGDEEKKRILRIQETHWMGAFVRKNMRHLGADFLDGWCRTVSRRKSILERLLCRYYIVKTPSFVLCPNWPEDYINQSTLFDDYRVIVMVRQPEEVFESGRKHFAHWRHGGVKQELFYQDWIRMHTAVGHKGPSWIMVRHSDLRDHTQKTLSAVVRWLSVGKGHHREFRVGTTDMPQWLTSKQHAEVESLFNASHVLMPEKR